MNESKQQQHQRPQYDLEHLVSITYLAGQDASHHHHTLSKEELFAIAQALTLAANIEKAWIDEAAPDMALACESAFTDYYAGKIQLIQSETDHG